LESELFIKKEGSVAVEKIAKNQKSKKKGALGLFLLDKIFACGKIKPQ